MHTRRVPTTLELKPVPKTAGKRGIYYDEGLCGAVSLRNEDVRFELYGEHYHIKTTGKSAVFWVWLSYGPFHRMEVCRKADGQRVALLQRVSKNEVRWTDDAGVTVSMTIRQHGWILRGSSDAGDFVAQVGPFPSEELTAEDDRVFAVLCCLLYWLPAHDARPGGI